jgi:MFS family permease
MLPASAGLFASALLGSALAKRVPARTLVRIGIAVVLLSVLLLLDTIEPELDNASFLIGMGVLGVGMGLVVSQLGNVVQSAVSDRDRSEAGGLQNTAQQLGSSLGTAFLGAVVLTGLLASFSANVASNPRIAGETQERVQTRLSAGGSFVASSEVEAAARQAGLEGREVSELVASYEDAQLEALKTALLFAALLVFGSFFATRDLPARRFDELAAPD